MTDGPFDEAFFGEGAGALWRSVSPSGATDFSAAGNACRIKSHDMVIWKIIIGG
jgi:hypothetical protein